MSFRSLPFIFRFGFGAAGLAMTALTMTASLATAQSAPTTTARTSDVVIPTEGDTAGGTTIGTGSTSTIPSTGNVPLGSVRFLCATENGRPTVMYQPEDQPGQRFAWAVPQQMGGGWTPERRCAEIASRLERYRPDGLVEMQTGVENGYNTVCVTTDNVPSCRIVFTVPKGQDPVSTRDRVFQNLAIADSGQRTAGVFTLRDQNANLIGDLGKALNIDLGGLLGSKTSQATATPAAPASNGIYLKPFLSKADGGTGERLNQIAVTKPQVAKPSSGKRLRRMPR
jgi:hypothetical protein